MQLSCMSATQYLTNFLIMFKGPTLVVNRAGPTLLEGYLKLRRESPFNKVFLDNDDKRRRHSLHLVQGEKKNPSNFFFNSQNILINLFSA